ncbi:MAG: GDP-mannose 4,6-dehydratase, partial [Candidatus Gracilibacteria bacterium]|nr:GDP-mannose 4,6-dehydratase [Candidatus Gracilibacteria bacterium]
MKKTILITGGTGYIGSHGVVAFEEAGYKCVIIDNLVNSSIDVLDGIEKILGYKIDFFDIDLRDKDKLKEIFQKYNFDGVLHFAGLKAVGESCEKPILYYDNNIVGSLKLFEVMQEFGVKNIIFSSSATVYKELKTKNRESRGFLETDEIGDCSNPYGTSKYLIEQVLLDLSKFAGFKVM